jgi:3'(2'), 5'-bisphosphate nucleotidase
MCEDLYMLMAIQSSLEAGYAILDVYHSDFSVEYKPDDSPLTLADKRSHEIIVNNLRPPGIPIISEEGRDTPYEQRKTWERLWLVDPLDGTKEFIKRNGEFTVNIALVENHKPVLGVIFVPDKDILYFASRKVGAFKLENSQSLGPLDLKGGKKGPDILLKKIIDRAVRLPVNISPLPSFTIVASRSHSTPELQAYVEEKRRDFGRVEFIAAGSSLKFCVVAEGRADVYPRLGPTMEWDTAAGHAITENAGSRVLRYGTQKTLVYNKQDLHNPWFSVSRKR